MRALPGKISYSCLVTSVGHCSEYCNMDHQKLIKQEMDIDDGFIDFIKEEAHLEDVPNFSPNRTNTRIKSDPYNKVHTGNTFYQCLQCEKHFAKQSSLHGHQKLHNNEKHFQCDVCDKQFTLKANLVRHQRIHNKETPYQCDVCNKQFKWKEHLVKHQRIHNKEKPYYPENSQ